MFVLVAKVMMVIVELVIMFIRADNVDIGRNSNDVVMMAIVELVIMFVRGDNVDIGRNSNDGDCRTGDNVGVHHSGG
ncbi:Hypothetical predicted protein [Octopus vulgaris]|uniref:Secreted protein n=1 Tax=Octopus vulgaris TaxID=6645 RepID=A0AA36B474_OCTVU|nr:Hypothetical predicted protein [Octopus vulgaris]